MNPAANLILVGPMGAGKSTLGKRLGELLELPFVDLDFEIERHTGASVTLIFEIEGEPGFREREARLLDEHSRRQGVVLATGGGAILRADNRALIAARGFVVYLQTEVAVQWERLKRDRSRPLLRTADPLARLQALAAERNALYEQVADLRWQAPGLAGNTSAERLAESLARHWQREVPA